MDNKAGPSGHNETCYVIKESSIHKRIKLSQPERQYHFEDSECSSDDYNFTSEEDHSSSSSKSEDENVW